MGSSGRCRRTSRGLARLWFFGVISSLLLEVASGWTFFTPPTRATKSSWTSFVARNPRDEVLCYSQPEYSYYDSSEQQKEPRQRQRRPPSADRDDDYWQQDKDENYRNDPYESNTRTVASNKDNSRDEYYYDDDYENDGSFDNEEEDDYYYNDIDEQQPPSNDDDTNSLEWETLSTDAGKVHVLLPRSPPTAILHFVGGTGVGSAPTVWYRRLLHDVVEQTQVAVVATSIPVTLLQSPLQHVPLARKLSRQLHIAYKDVLCDEYGKSAMKDIPLCGLGHSLGSRLLVVLATLQQPKSSKSLQYKSFILTSFTNYGAAAGIPGLQQLGKSSRQVDRDRMRQARQQKQQQQPKRRRKRRGSRNNEDDDVWLNDNDSNDEYGYYDDDDDEEEWGEIFQDLQASLQDQALSVRRALTPSAETLEFHPSPTLLWKALGQDQRYNIPHTLVVQLDNDEMDQSVPLVNAIRQTSNVKFARLRGTHWTMVSPGDDWQKDWRQQLNVSRALKALAGRKQSQANEESWRDLRQTIARYITEVVTKD